MTNHLDNEIRAIVARMDEQHDNPHKEQDSQKPPEEIQDVYVLIVREHEEVEETAQVVDSTPLVPSQPAPDTTQHDSSLSTYVFVSCFLFLALSTLMFQCFCMMNPPVATITIIPTAKTVSLNGTLQLGRVLSPLTISQSQTTATTGKGHQDASAASGTITFYNGLFTEQTVAPGTILTGSDGVQIVTTQEAVISPATPNPLAFGYVSVAAQATTTGARGNISAYDINQTCCSMGILAKNTFPFHGGQEARNYQFVTKTDIHNATSPLKAALAQSTSGALLEQLRNSESIATSSCTTATTSDHQPGSEATTVKVIVSETCSGVAVNTDALNTKVTDLLNDLAAKKLGPGYSLLGSPQISVTSVTVSKQVTLSFKSLSTWVYALSSTEQKKIKNMIAGKTKEKAMQYLLSLPGLESVSINSSGFADDTIPRDIERIHFQLLIGGNRNLPESTKVAELSFEDVSWT
jgi:hypothetical protein